MIGVKEVSKIYNGNVVLKSISLEIEEKEVLGIYGPNGSGKSTLLRIIAGFEKPSCGRIYFLDREITGLKAEKVVELGVAYASQIPKPFKKLTVLENLVVASLLRNNMNEALVASQKLCRELGLEKIMYEKSVSLSQGELRLLEIARAVATEPKVLLLDEPFSGLDVRNTVRTMKILLKLRKKGLSMIITAHRVRILEEVADRCLELKGGRIVKG